MSDLITTNGNMLKPGDMVYFGTALCTRIVVSIVPFESHCLTVKTEATEVTWMWMRGPQRFSTSITNTEAYTVIRNVPVNAPVKR